MDLKKQYDMLAKWCASRLKKELHARHLEDIVQYVAMEVFANSSEFDKFGLRGRWDWYFANYCRMNGLNQNNRSKLSAKTLEHSSFVGDETWKLDNHNIYVTPEKESKGLELMDEFLSVLHLNKEAYQWAMKIRAKRL